MIDDELLRVLRGHLGPEVSLAAKPVAMKGGFWASIYSFALRGASAEWSVPLVARIMPDDIGAPREIAVQRIVAELGFTTPHVLLAGEDQGLGGAYMVMERASGRSPIGGLDLGPKTLVTLPGVLRRLPRQLATVAVALHALDPRPVRSALAEIDRAAGRADGGRLGVDSRLEIIGSARGPDTHGFAALSAWLDRHRPAVLDHTDRGVVCHGDLHPLNLLVDDDGTVTVLDWTNANVAPREFDIGFSRGLIRCASMDAPKPLAPIVRWVTKRLSNQFVHHYEASGQAVDHAVVDWFEALQHGRCLAEVVSARRGLTHIVHERHPFELSAPAMIDRLAELTSAQITLPPRQPAPAS